MIFAIVSFSSKWINFLVRENDKIAWHPAFCLSAYGLSRIFELGGRKVFFALAFEFDLIRLPCFSRG